MAQLPLALALEDHASFATFVERQQRDGRRARAQSREGDGDTVWLWGAAGAGKSHLLQAACRAATAAERRAMYVALPAASPAILADLEHVDLLAIDDVQTVAGDLAWEQPLFVILNAFLSRSGALLLAANAPAAQCGFRLADFASRGAGAVTYRLAPLDDTDRAAALRLHAAARGLELDAAAAEFLLKRVARDMTALTAWLARLDRASLTAQRRLTIPFIREHIAPAPNEREQQAELEHRSKQRDARATARRPSARRPRRSCRRYRRRAARPGAAASCAARRRDRAASAATAAAARRRPRVAAACRCRDDARRERGHQQHVTTDESRDAATSRRRA